MPALNIDADAFRHALGAWYRRSARALPWRESPSLYKTVVSEFMLQQTQVKTVLPYFARWLGLFPDFAALAAAPEAAVVKAWEGLGYYSRSRNLHRLAKAVAGLSAPPRTPAEWLELPGIGPYTAAAVTSIAFGEPAACVDGNVVRILARITGDAAPYRDSASAAKAFAPLAKTLIEGADHPGDHNQAMMELGATLCTRHKPQCLICPVAAFCAAARSGDPEAYPQLAAKTIERRAVVRIWCVKDDALLLHRAAASASRLAGLHELPTAAQAGLSPESACRGRLLAQKTRGITRYHFTESIHEAPCAETGVAETPPSEAASDGELVWVPFARIGQVSLSGPHRRWVTELLAAHHAS